MAGKLRSINIAISWIVLILYVIFQIWTCIPVGINVPIKSRDYTYNAIKSIEECDNEKFFDLIHEKVRLNFSDNTFQKMCEVTPNLETTYVVQSFKYTFLTSGLKVYQLTVLSKSKAKDALFNIEIVEPVKDKLTISRIFVEPITSEIKKQSKVSSEDFYFTHLIYLTFYILVYIFWLTTIVKIFRSNWFITKGYWVVLASQGWIKLTLDWHKPNIIINPASFGTVNQLTYPFNQPEYFPVFLKTFIPFGAIAIITIYYLSNATSSTETDRTNK